MTSLLHTMVSDDVAGATVAEPLAVSGPPSAPGARAVAGGVHDPERLAASWATGLLDTPPEPASDRRTRLAAGVLRAPTAAVSLVDGRRQFFKRAVRLPEPWASRRETPLSHSFCQHVMTEIELRSALAAAQAQAAEAERAASELARTSVHLELLRATAAEANAAATSGGALRACMGRVCGHMGWPVGHVYAVAPGESGLELVPTELWHLDDAVRFEGFREVTMQTRLPSNFGLLGRVLAEGRARWLSEVGEGDDFVRQGAARASGLRGGVAFPVLVGDEVAAVLEFYSERAEGPDGQLLEVMADLGLQLGRAVERERARVILERHAAENQALSVTDELTGLHNRRGFLERAAPPLERAARTGKPALIFFAGLNELKQINDGLGHGAGDKAIREVARLLRATFCEFDVLARFGGGEFVALRPEGAPDLVETLRGRLSSLLEAYNAASGRPFRLSVSLGVAIYDPHQPRPLATLFAEADAAMQEQKRLRELAGVSLPAPAPRVTELIPRGDEA